MNSSRATTLDLRSSVCIRLLDTSLTLSHSLPNHRLGVAETRWLDYKLTPLPKPQLHALGLVSHWSKGGEWGALKTLLFF